VASFLAEHDAALLKPFPGVRVTAAPEHSTRVEFANSLRGLAALSVLISHYLGVFWLKREITANFANAPILPSDEFPLPLYVRLLHPIESFDWGSFGVGLFFLISGFVIPFSLQRYDWKAFAVGRFFRLYPTYAAGLTLCIVAIYLSGLYFGRDFPYSASEVALHYLVGARDLTWSRSIDGIIWTLEIEVHFYLLCALAATWLRRGSFLLLIVPLAILAGSLLLGRHMAGWGVHNAPAYHLGYVATFNGQFLIYMFIGVAFNLHHRGILRSGTLPFVAAGLFGLFAATWYCSVHRDFFDQIWSYGAALAVFCAAAGLSDRWPRSRLLSFSADISYPLYVVHGVAGYVALRILLDLGVEAWLSVAFVTAAAIGLAWAVHVWIEAPTHRLGQRLAKGQTALPSAAIEPIRSTGR
jgi:peptidoglycan/LPS O-acetylase OafA/YrhL